MSDTDDQREIERLHAIFVHAVDRGDFALARSLYTDDAVDLHGGYNGPVDGYIEWAKTTVSAFERSAHMFFTPLIFVSGDEAESETKGQVFIRTKGEVKFDTVGVFRQFDRYRRTPQGWRFTHRAICFDWAHSYPADDDPPDPEGAMLKGSMDTNDPFYSHVPLLAAEMRRRAEAPREP